MRPRPSTTVSDPSAWSLDMGGGRWPPGSPSGRHSKSRNAHVWRSQVDASAALPPLSKGASRHRCPVVQHKHAALDGSSVLQVALDEDAAESFGRRRLGQDSENWAKRVFEVTDGSGSGYLCPVEFAAAVQTLRKHLGVAATARFRERGGAFYFTAADTKLEGRISVREFCTWAAGLEATFGLQRCAHAACVYLGMRQAENRRRLRAVEYFQGFSWQASLDLLTACSQQGSSSLYENVCTALERKADPNASLTDPLHHGYTPLIFLAMTPPTVRSQVSMAIDALVAAGADVHRESGPMPFGKWGPLRFAAFMQNRDGLDTLLRHADAEQVMGDRYMWAAGENVEYVMLEELRKEFGDALADKVQSLSRYSVLATVLLQQYASPIAATMLTPLGARQLIEGEFQSGSLPKGCKADPNGPGLEGRTALMDVVAAGDVETAKALLRARADPNCKDSSGATALHLGAASLKVDVVRVLLHAKAMPHEVDHAGFSAWMVVGEELAHSRDEEGVWHVRSDGRMGSPDARRELLDLLKPQYTAEEIIRKAQEDPMLLVDRAFAGPEPSIESLTARFRLHESLFFSSKLADGHGAHEGRRERADLLAELSAILLELLRSSDLKGDQKVLTRYLLMATMGPSGRKTCAHVHSPWPTDDNRATYRAALTQVAKDMLGKFALECDQMRQRIEFRADTQPESACAALRRLPHNLVTIPERWQERGHPDCDFWRAVQERQLLRFDPRWALEVGGSPTRCSVALLRLGAVADLAGCSALQQVHHAPMVEVFARGYIRYSQLCNEPFQRKMTEIARRVAEREGLDMSPPKQLVAAKRLKRLMEKTKDACSEFGDMRWPGRSEEYLRYSHSFHIQDTVRMSFTCNGKSTAEQVKCCMHLFDEFRRCTVEHDGVCVLRQKNGFAAGVKGSGGYADVKLLIYAELGTHRAFDGSEVALQIVGEVQLILDGYMRVKNKMHLVYEVDRGSFDHAHLTEAQA